MIRRQGKQVNLRPAARELSRGSLEKKRTGSFSKGDLEIVIAAFAMHSNGKVPDVKVGKKTENGYASVRSRTNVRCGRCRVGQFGAAQPAGQGTGQLARDRGPPRGVSLGERHPTTVGHR